jgi:hypothetical protein
MPEKLLFEHSQLLEGGCIQLGFREGTLAEQK